MADNAENKLYDEVLGPREAALVIDVRPETLCRWRKQRRGPPFAQCGRVVRYSKRQLLAWLAGEGAKITPEAA